ncbi:hypothetical protein [Leptospira stimsonii]|uniref:Uncharacterized protein n=1 Tax=Leptospira stimsonii TaxID=2202203 RepID=A0A8B3CQQ5_9LEPT|nr:hypothetical protein [Leptospira stimsonii]RHX85375.1 hypothetical protein DLM78_14850 [Leptospira stimsonii]
MNINPTKFLEREKALKTWPQEKNQSLLLDKMENLFHSMPKEKVYEKLKFGLESALIDSCCD